MKKLLPVFAAVSLAIVVMLAGAGTANAVSVTHTHSQGLDYQNVSFNGGTSYTSSYLGRFILQSTALPPSYPTYTVDTVHGPEANSFYSYCLEPAQSIGVGHGAMYDFTIDSLVGTDGISAPEAVLISELFGRYSPLLQNDPTGPYTGGTFRTAAAAIQLAIWKINLDAATETLGWWDFGSGLMRVGTVAESGASKTADVVALEMLNSITGSGPMASGLQGLRNNTVQDLLIQAVPEPSSLLALVGGLGCLIPMLRRRR